MLIKDIINKYYLLKNRSKSRSMGQNFLVDENILNDIACACEPFNDCDLIEIGPGPCGLTIAVRQRANNKIICIEKDKSLAKLHDDIRQQFTDIDFIYDDALNVNFNNISNNDVIVFANLPYNVGTKILTTLITKYHHIQKIVVMLQKEVVNRICADVNTKDYGLLSVLCQSACKVQNLFDVDRSAFYPKPKVTSSIVRLYVKQCDQQLLNQIYTIASLCFSQKRKTIYKLLKQQFDHLQVDEAMWQLGIHHNARAESLSIDAYRNLAKLLMHDL